MNPRTARLRAAQRWPENDDTPFDSPDHERLMLLELATDLESWPARNLVFREALERAARDLARLASETGSA